MRSIRTFAYAATLGLSMFTLQPTLAAAEDAHGSFKLTHEVALAEMCASSRRLCLLHEYNGRPTFLTLRGLNGTGTDAVLLVSDIETPKPDDTNRLDLVSISGKSFVSAMTLPEYDLTLRFAVPPESPSK